MKTLILALIVLPLGLLAQTRTDSLLNQLLVHRDRDTVRVRLLNEIGFEHWVIDASHAEAYGSEAILIADSLHYIPGLAMGHRVAGVAHWSLGNFYQALRHLMRSREYYHQLHDRLGEANVVLNIGLVYGDQQQSDEALRFYFEALRVFSELKQHDREATTWTKIGTVYIETRNYKEAAEYLHRALAVHEANNFEFGILEVSNRLGILETRLQNFSHAEEFFLTSLSLAEKRNDSEHIIKNLENLARLELDRGAPDNAHAYLTRAYPLAKNLGYKKWLRDILWDLKEFHQRRGDYAGSLAFFEEYVAVRDSIFNESKALQMANLRIQHEVEARERVRENDFRLLHEQTRFNRLANYALFTAIVGVAVFSTILFRVQRSRLRKNRELIKSNRELFESREKLIAVELENARLKEEELNRELLYKSKELTAATLTFIHKNELFEQIKGKLEIVKNAPAPAATKEINGMLRLIQENQHFDKEWEDFRKTFESVHHQFFSRLLAYCPELSQTELKLCSLIILNLSMKETAALMGIAPESVKTARYRLRKKLSLDHDHSLLEFISALSSDKTING
jgi:DNA-binding CsgD family transcriptional regulator